MKSSAGKKYAPDIGPTDIVRNASLRIIISSSCKKVVGRTWRHENSRAATAALVPVSRERRFTGLRSGFACLRGDVRVVLKRQVRDEVKRCQPCLAFCPISQ